MHPEVLVRRVEGVDALKDEEKGVVRMPIGKMQAVTRTSKGKRTHAPS